MVFDKIKIFGKEIWTEGRKVDWPTKQETLRYTIIVIVISVCVAAFLGLLDMIFFKVISRFIV